MKTRKLEQQIAEQEAKTARLETRLKEAHNQRFKLLGMVAEELLNDPSFKTAFNEKALELLSYNELKELELTDRYGNDIAERLTSVSK
ncbi:hypothetical protein [Marinospirillum insulare]|uniref:Phage protein n=1 Tax=Marinospirillum insulare TaxID=217169 RepID=A0ABQ5ZVW5_9GAMM|nr:hypothetical protein [Marinospirillum insulare]GLR63596.1 hypothetical protein GCM10007878_10310 [Marinospirillum insulare]